MSQTIPLPTARRIIVNSQLLNGSSHLSGREGVMTCINLLGYIQIDTIAVIERAHHHTLWTRVPDYRPNVLHDLQSRGEIFEYWGHAMSFLPMSDYRYYLPRIQSFHNPRHYWFKERQELYGHYTPVVLDRIKNEGPLQSSDFERKPGEKRGSWFEHKTAKGALELLFWRGDIMVKERRQFQKVYDLTERILPKSTDTSFPSPEEWGTFFVNRAIQALGVAGEKDILNYIETTDAVVLSNCLKNLAENGTVLEVKIEGLKGTYFTSKYNLNKDISEQNKSVYILSPFDNLTISRDRLQRFFDFHYNLECYLPPAKRKFGYFGLPILYGDQFVGKIDAKADRPNKELLINYFALENETIFSEALFLALVKKLEDFSRFNNCQRIRFANSDAISKKLQPFITLE